MSYIAEIPDSLVTFDGNAWIIDTNESHFLNEFYTNINEITGSINATNEGGEGTIAEPGETLTVPTADGDVTGSYIGPVILSTQSVYVGALDMHVAINPINGHIMRADDGTAYVITDQPVDRDHLGATASLEIAGRTITVSAPLSELTSALSDELNAIADQLGPIAGLPFRSAATIADGLTHLTQTIFDLVDVTLEPGTGTLAVVCFTKGTLILTENGYVPVESLVVGDKVETRDNGLQEIRWKGSNTIGKISLLSNPKLYPIRIKKGALGENMPDADLCVSQQHRILIKSKIAQRLCDTNEVLVAAKLLLQIDGVDVVKDLPEVEYFHILFDRHEVIYSNGAQTESLFTGPEALKSVGKAASEEILSIFPQLNDEDYESDAIRHIPSGRLARKMIIRHLQNKKPLVQQF